jgi:hypothetical protein
MGSRERTLLDQIERDALDSSTRLADALRKCVALAGKADSDALLRWANRELRGYGPDDKLPEYRVVRAAILLDGVNGNYAIRGQRISPSSLPSVAHGKIDESLHLAQPVGQLEDLAAQAKGRSEAVKFSLPGGAELVLLMNHEASQPYQVIHNLYWSTDASTIASVCDNVRTTLVELVATLRRGMANGEEVPSSDLAERAVGLAVYGDRSTVIVGNVLGANVGSNNNSIQQEIVTSAPRARMAAKLVAVLAGVATLLVAVIKVIEALHVPFPWR